jgi:hypothetical protein
MRGNFLNLCGHIAIRLADALSPLSKLRWADYIILFFAMLCILPVSFAHTATMNFRFHIADIGDVVRVNGTNYTGQALLSFTDLSKPYISAERADKNNTLVVLSMLGGLVEGTVDKQSDPYMFKVTQDENNGFLLALTEGDWRDADALQGKIPARTVGQLPLPESFVRGIALQLRLDGIDLTGSLGAGMLLVKSLGRLRLPLVDMVNA